MRHYVLEFGPWASPNAKLRNSLPEDDLRQQKLDQDRLSAAFVVSILNGILRDIAISTMNLPADNRITFNGVRRTLMQDDRDTQRRRPPLQDNPDFQQGRRSAMEDQRLWWGVGVIVLILVLITLAWNYDWFGAGSVTTPATQAPPATPSPPATK